MNAKFRIMLLVAVACLISSVSIMAVEVSAVPEAKEILSRTLEKIRPIRSARYMMTEYRYASLIEPFHSDKSRRMYTECVNPGDTSGLPRFVAQLPDGKVYMAYDGKASVYGREGYYERNDLSRNYGVRYIDPPFFNHVTRLCEYLLRPGGNRELTVVDTDTCWTVNIVLSEYQRIAFHGNAYVSRSYPDEKTYFSLTVDKLTYMPERLSYQLGVPANRYEKTVSDVELNPVEAETFDIGTYLADMPVYDDEEEIRMIARKAHEDNMRLVESGPLPGDTLKLVGGGEISLNDSKGKIRVLLLTSNYCGFCKFATPVVNKLYEDYSADDVAVLGVVLQTEAEMPTLEALKRDEGMRFPLAKNNGHFYEYFLPSGLAPAILVIGPDDNMLYWQLGFSKENSAKIDARLRKSIDGSIRQGTGD